MTSSDRTPPRISNSKQSLNTVGYTVPIKAPYLAEREICNRIYIVNPDSPGVPAYCLRDSARLVWTLINGTHTLRDIAETVRAHSHIVEHHVDLTTAFLLHLESLGLIRIAAPVTTSGPTLFSHFTQGYSALQEKQELLNDLFALAAPKRILLKADLELTYSCNHRCLHCYNTKQRSTRLSVHEHEELIDQLAEMQCLFLTFTGGEVLTYKNFLRLAEKAQNKKFSVTILTNGSLINKSIADALSALHAESVEISLCGTSPKSHDAFTRTPGSFDRVLAGAALLSERGVNTFLRYVFTKHNVAEAKDLPAIADAVGAKFGYPRPHLFPTVDGDMHPVQHGLTDDQIVTLYREGITYPVRRNRCFAGVSKCRISPSGDVHACEFLPHWFGNVRQRSLSDIWSTSKQGKNWEDETIHYPPTCQMCANRSICTRCPAMSYLEDGSLHSASSQACRIAKLTRQGLLERERIAGDS